MGCPPLFSVDWRDISEFSRSNPAVNISVYPEDAEFIDYSVRVSKIVAARVGEDVARGQVCHQSLIVNFI